MVPDAATTTTDDGYGTLVNALIGAVVGVLLSWIPLAPLLGGAVAGYLEGGDPRDWTTVGAVAGAVMLVPLALIGTALLFFLGFGLGVGLGNGGPLLAFVVLAVVALLVSALYTVGLSAVGGYLGGYLERER